MPLRQRARRLLGLWLLPALAGCGSAERRDAAPAPDPAAPRASEERAGTGSPDEEPPGAADAETQLRRLEQDYAKALIAKDRAFLMSFYAGDWRGGNWMGFWTKSTMLKSVLSERYVVKSMVVRDVKVRVVGDVAIVQGVDDEVSSVDGRDTSGKWTFTDIFARRDGRWQAIASHTSEVRPTGR